MARLAQALGKEGDARGFQSRFDETLRVFQERLFDAQRGLYRDGIGTDHCSQHANLFPLAFGLVPVERRRAVVDWLTTRGMHCSVYAAQYLLEGLFEYGGEQKAIDLIMADTGRSWRHMVESGTTITWEAWDLKYKPNQDWNHAWGAAPANLLPRYVLGVQPLEAGWKRALVRPCPGPLATARGKVPTRRGPISVNGRNTESFRISIRLPAGVCAKVELPGNRRQAGVFVNGEQVNADYDGGRWSLVDDVSGIVDIEAK